MKYQDKTDLGEFSPQSREGRKEKINMGHGFHPFLTFEPKVLDFTGQAENREIFTARYAQDAKSAEF